MLKLSPNAFDQDLHGGWRPLGDRPECAAAAADLLAAYRKAHWGELNPAQLHTNYWHEGQLRAAAGDSSQAIGLLLAGVNPDDPGNPEDYALATVAFLEHDRGALLAARNRLAGTPQPPWFAGTAAKFEAKFHRKLSWPMNLDVVDGFVACFDKPYREAYTRACRPENGARAAGG